MLPKNPNSKFLGKSDWYHQLVGNKYLLEITPIAAPKINPIMLPLKIGMVFVLDADNISFLVLNRKRATTKIINANSTIENVLFIGN